MAANKYGTPVRSIILGVLFFLLLAGILGTIFLGKGWIFLLAIALPMTVIALIHANQKKKTILRNFPLIGSLRYFFESIRPELRQYFWESDNDGVPFSRRQRSIVYQRSKNELETVAFGMQSDPNAPGYEWVSHSAFPVSITKEDLRVTVGNEQCTQPYSLSIMNISAMSYGALSKTAITALNEGAALDNFAHNTGEGGISEYHLKGGDLIWQVGTGYFGCRTEDGRFSPELFAKNASRPEVKMVELKLSQGAKPGHGGILPANKNTPEIAAIRNVEPGTTVASPPAHSAFSNSNEMIDFIGTLRKLSNGKPVGFKLSLGDKEEFLDICEAMYHKEIYPDFIAIDGAEGGTGAAPLEFTDNIGMPIYEALTFVHQALQEFGIRKHIKLLVSGKVITAFDIMKMMALGADACYSARGMMFSLGCIQALECNKDTCPVGVATQNPNLYKGLDVNKKKVRVAQFHHNTIKAVMEMMEACGFKTINDIHPKKFHRKIDAIHTMTFEEIYFEAIDKTIVSRKNRIKHERLEAVN